MEKAYDLKALGQIIIEKAKARGLTIAEDLVESLASAVYLGFRDWQKQSAELTPTAIDNMIEGLTVHLDTFVLPQIVKTDFDGDGK